MGVCLKVLGNKVVGGEVEGGGKEVLNDGVKFGWEERI